MTHFAATHVRARLASARHGLSEPRSVTLILTVTDTAWNPASTKDVLNGPARVRYTEYADGGITAQVGPAPQVGLPRRRTV
jgi:hypothetical protein